MRSERMLLPFATGQLFDRVSSGGWDFEPVTYYFLQADGAVELSPPSKIIVIARIRET